MCGRYFLKLLDEDVARELDAIYDTFDEHGEPVRFNIAPSHPVLVLRYNAEKHERHLGRLQWGLLPSFAKDRKIAWKLSNARGETVDTLPSFRAAFARRRCLVPLSGFYEWRTVGKRKYPFAAALKDEGLMTVAGLWEAWKEPETGRYIRSCTLITTEPNALMAEVHNRMPVIVKAEDRALWLGETPGDKEALKALLKPYPAAQMKLWQVSPAINRPGLDSPHNLDPWTEPPLLQEE